MMSTPRPKRRWRPTFAARLRRFWILGVALLALVAAGAFALATAPAFRLHELTVTGLSHVARGDVVARAAIDRHANVWLLDAGAIEGRIEALPYVATVHVHRRPLGNLWIDVVERTADGCVQWHGAAEFTIDRSDRVLERGCAASVALAYDLRAGDDVPPGRYVRDPELAALQRDARGLAAATDRFRMLRHDAYGQLEGDLQDGIRIRFGDDRDLGRKQRLVGPILAQLGSRVATVRALDLRAPATPVVEFQAPLPTAPP